MGAIKAEKLRNDLKEHSASECKWEVKNSSVNGFPLRKNKRC